MLITPSIGCKNYDVHTKFCANLSVVSKTEMQNAIYRQRGERMTTFLLTRGNLALKGWGGLGGGDFYST